MRGLLSVAFLLCFFLSKGDIQYQIFEKEGRQGLADAISGKELIPPVYEKLGWSKGKFQLIGDLLGYQEEGKWGLITVNNKRIYEPEYYQLSILDEKHILASIKGTFTNQLYHGLIDSDGRKRISCNYFDIKKLKDAFLVITYDGSKLNKGLFNSRYELLIRSEYQEIQKASDHLWAARDFNYKWHFFDLTGEKILDPAVDRFIVRNDGIELEKFGKKGFISSKGEWIHPLSFKKVSKNTAEKFPEWEIFDHELNQVKSGIAADSLGIFRDLFITYSNGNQDILLDTEKLYGEKNIELKDARAGYLVARELESNQWSLKTTGGKEIAAAKDSIFFDGIYFYALEDGSWEVFNRFGRMISPKNFDQVAPAVNHMVPVKKKDYWGLMDFQGELINGIKFDSIGEGNGRSVAIKYLGDWGVANGFGNWEIKPSFREVFFFEDIIAARKGEVWFMYDIKHRLVNKITYPLEKKENLIEIRNNQGEVGIVSGSGFMVAYPVYKKVSKLGNNYIAATEKYSVMLDPKGKFLISPDENVQQIDLFSEEYYRIYKDGSYGFVDTLGRLRIANRYEDAGRFRNDRAPVKLNGKWGYIDHREILVIQPFYDYASSFENGLAIIVINGRYGLIDKGGNEIISPQYAKIKHKKGNGYILVTDEGNSGVADEMGHINLRPRFEEIKEVGNDLLIVTAQGKTGIMDTKGYTRVPMEYDEIRLLGDYLLLKKEVSSQ